jgi:glycosyltransferase involved in cell wall biosynthesis
VSRVKVLWLIKGLGPGGAEKLLVTHARFGDHQIFEYSAAYFVPWKDQIVPELADFGVEATCLGTGRDADIRWVFRLWLHLWKGRFDVVHVHSPQPAAATRVLVKLLPKKRRPRLVYTEHNEWGKHRRSTRWMNQHTMRWAGRVFAVSKGVARSMNGGDDVEVLYHGIDMEAVQATTDRLGVREELGISNDAFVIGTVANLRWEKGYDVLLKAARRLLLESKTGTNTWFLSVGQGPLEDELMVLHDQFGLGDRFRFLGYRGDATRVMSTFDVFCLASRHEGLPVVLMEAAALGIPIVATDVGGIREVVAADNLVATDDVDALVNGLVGAREDGVGSTSPPLIDLRGQRFVARLEAGYRVA